MRPLFHPVDQGPPRRGDPARAVGSRARGDFARIAASAGSQNCSNFLKISEKDIPKSTLSQHFKILRDAGLIRSERRGVEMQNASRCSEIDTRFPGLIAAIIGAHRVQSKGRRRPTKARGLTELAA